MVQISTVPIRAALINAIIVASPSIYASNIQNASAKKMLTFSFIFDLGASGIP